MMNKLQQLESSTGVGEMASSGGGAVYPVLPSITNITNIGHAGHLATGQPLSTLPILQSCHPSNLMLPLHYTQLQTFDQSQTISIPGIVFCIHVKSLVFQFFIIYYSRKFSNSASTKLPRSIVQYLQHCTPAIQAI